MRMWSLMTGTEAKRWGKGLCQQGYAMHGYCQFHVFALTNVCCMCRVIAALVAYAQSQGCYKVILDCADSNVPFYERCGFTRKEVQMVSYIRRAAL